MRIPQAAFYYSAIKMKKEVEESKQIKVLISLNQARGLNNSTIRKISILRMYKSFDNVLMRGIPEIRSRIFR